jgi:transposase
LGFIDAVELNFISFITESNCDKYATKIAHEELRSFYPDGKEIIVIQDNASYNHAYAGTDRIKELNITPLFLPAYCPNLNLIERIWKFMKKEIMKNKYYPTFKDFFQAIVDFCGDFDKYTDEIEKLICQNFQILKAG